MKWILVLLVVNFFLTAPVYASFMKHTAEYKFDGDFTVEKWFGGQFEGVSTEIEGSGKAEIREAFEIYDGVCDKYVEITWYDLF